MWGQERGIGIFQADIMTISKGEGNWGTLSICVVLLQREEYKEGISLEAETNIWEWRGQVKSLGQSTTTSLPHKTTLRPQPTSALGVTFR